MIALTPALLRAATGCTQDAADLYAQPLAEACAYYGIDTPARLAAFLAQLAHESGSFRHTREVWGPTLAQDRYEGRRDLGNVYPGDGKLFAGHGLLQITGRANHAAVRDRLREAFGPEVPDFERDPEALMQPRWACLSAADWWAHHGCNELADAGDYIGIGRLINRGSATTDRPANGEADRLQRWERAKAALGDLTSGDPPASTPRETAENEAAEPAKHADLTSPPSTPKGAPMAPFIAAALPLIVEAIPKLGKLFGSGSQVAERNVAAAETVVQIVQAATGTTTAQAAVEAIQSDPVKRQAAAEAIEARWYDLTEAGGGGIDGARKADAAASSRGDMLHSPSFWIASALLVLVFWMMGNVMGLYGAEMDEKVRSAIINGAQGMILGGIVGYFFGQTTSRNRTPAA